MVDVVEAKHGAQVSSDLAEITRALATLQINTDPAPAPPDLGRAATLWGIPCTTCGADVDKPCVTLGSGREKHETDSHAPRRDRVYQDTRRRKGRLDRYRAECEQWKRRHRTVSEAVDEQTQVIRDESERIRQDIDEVGQKVVQAVAAAGIYASNRHSGTPDKAIESGRSWVVTIYNTWRRR